MQQLLNEEKQRYPKSFIEKIKQERHINCPKPCQWGKDKESKAIEEYLKSKTNQGESVSGMRKLWFYCEHEIPLAWC